MTIPCTVDGIDGDLVQVCAKCLEGHPEDGTDWCSSCSLGDERDDAQGDLDVLDGRSFALDGAPLERPIGFCMDNELPEETLRLVASLEVGAELPLGGGAFATFILKRTA